MANQVINIVIKTDDKSSAPIRSVSEEMDRATGSSGRFKGALSVLGPAAVAVGLALSAASGATGLFAVKAAADYEQSLNIFRAVSSASADEMKRVGDTARALGQDMTLPGISAKDAALAMVELSKAGISVNDTLAASKGVLSLAKAGQVDTAFAAEVTANALNAFSLAGTEANRVADMLAGGANGSSASIQDLALGMQMASASAATLKMPIGDLVAALGLMSNNAIKGSDAGTSLKTFMNSLTPVTTKQKDAMQAMNLQFYDAQGNFVGLRAAAQQLQDGTKGMTTEQKLLNLEMAFGSDAMRAAAVLAKEGAGGYDKLAASVNKVGAATDLAAAQNAGFNGALDALKSSLETVAIEAGAKVLPALTDVTKFLAANVEPAFNAVSAAIKNVSGAVALMVTGDFKGGMFAQGIAEDSKVVDVILGIREAFVAAWNVIGPAVTEFGQVIMKELVPALQEWWTQVSPVMIPALKLLATVLGAALVGSIWLVVKAATVATKTIAFFYQLVAGGIAWAKESFAQGVLGMVTAWNMVTAFFAGVPGFFQQIWVDTLTAVSEGINSLVAFFAGLPQNIAFALGAVAGFLYAFLTRDVPAFVDGVIAWFNALPGRVGEAISQMYLGVIAWFSRTSADAQSTTNSLVDGVVGWFQKLPGLIVGVAASLWTGASQAFENFKTSALKWAARTVDGIVGYFNELPGKMTDAVSKGISQASADVGNFFDGIGQSFSEGFNFGAHALGTNSSSGGWKTVGEHGPERVFMPRGAEVVPAYRTRAEGPGGNAPGAPVHIDKVEIHNNMDADKFLRSLSWRLAL